MVPVLSNIIFISLISFVVFFIILLALKNGSIGSCKNYILNVYLYVAFSYLFTRICIYIIDIIYNNDGLTDNLIIENDGIFIASCVMALVSLTLITLTTNIYKTYILYFIFLMSLSFILRPIFKYKETVDVVNNSLLQTVFMLLIMSIVSILFSKYIDRYGNFILTGLVVGLFSIIIMTIYNIETNRYDIQALIEKQQLITYFSIVIFAMFLAYDSYRIRENALMCPLNGNKSSANYPKASLNIYLDIINTLINLFNIHLDLQF